MALFQDTSHGIHLEGSKLPDNRYKKENII